MTHDELLAKVFQEYANTYEDLSGNIPMSPKALLAVVELHKPQPDHCPCCPPVLCECAEVYPCPTIKAIEKEIGL